MIHLLRADARHPPLAPNSIDTIVTDPPYGLEFMGKGWDRFDHRSWPVEALRVAKPGTFLLAFGGTRTWHRLACALEDAGWEIRDTLMWLYGSGFPKSANFGRALAGWNGYGTALKPAWEPIIIAMKPLDSTFARNAEKWGVAGLDIDGARIAADGPSTSAARRQGSTKHCRPGEYPEQFGKMGNRTRPEVYATPRAGELLGRWPANLALDEEAAAMLDEMSGEQRDGASINNNRNGDEIANEIYGARRKDTRDAGYGGSGGASRFFYTAKASRTEREAGLRDLPLVSRQDQSAWIRECKVCGDRFTNPGTGRPACGHDDFGFAPPSNAANHHPTVKPLALMRWLVRLTSTPTGGLVLDPFMGSGTTGMACVLEGRDFIGIEREAEYIGIARGRIVWAEKELERESAQGDLFPTATPRRGRVISLQEARQIALGILSKAEEEIETDRRQEAERLALMDDDE